MGLVTQTIAFAAGIIPTASEWSNQFDTLYNLVNGQLDSANVDKTSADGIMVLDTAQTRTATLTQSADLFVSNTYGLTIGHGSQLAAYGVTPEFQIHGTAGADATGVVTRFSADATGPTIALGKSRAATIGTFTVVQDNDVLGEVIFLGADGTDMATPGARIHAEVDGTPGGNDLPTALVFSTTADGAATVTEAFRISAARVHTFSGQVTVGVNDTGYDVQFFGATSGKYLLWDESEDTLQLVDNTNLTFGTGNDADIYYDGTDLIINPAVVGAGDVVLTGGSLEFDDSEGVTFGTGKDATLRYDGTDVVLNPRAVGSGDFILAADDGGALGKSGTGWSDLFLASGGVVNFNAGDVTLTHSANTLTLGGADNGLTISAAHSGTVRPRLILKNATAGTTFSASLLFQDGDGNDGWEIGANQTVGSGYLEFNDGASNRAIFDSQGNFMVGDTANSAMTLGITVNQASADDEILAFKSTDINHGITAITEFDTYGRHRKYDGPTGGYRMDGFSEGTRGMDLNGFHTTDDTTDTSSSNAAVVINGALKSGTSVTSVADGGNVFGVTNNATTRFLIKGNGDGHITNTTLVALDDHPDALVMRAGRAAMAPEGSWLHENFKHLINDYAPILERHRIMFFERNEQGRVVGAMNNIIPSIMLAWDGLFQHHQKIEELERRLAVLEA